MENCKIENNGFFYPTIELNHVYWDLINFTSKHKYDIYVLHSLWVPRGTFNNATGTMFQTSYKGTYKKSYSNNTSILKKLTILIKLIFS